MGKTAAAPKATPYPQKSSEPAAPRQLDPAPRRAEPVAPPQGEMLRGFVREGAIHLLGGKSLPDGVFVKIIRE